jgi:hypothetical protein
VGKRQHFLAGGTRSPSSKTFKRPIGLPLTDTVERHFPLKKFLVKKIQRRKKIDNLSSN